MALADELARIAENALVPFKLGSFSLRSGAAEEVSPVEIGGLQLLPEPLVRIRRSHAYKRTKIQGMNGTIKEDGGLDDAQISISGVLEAYGEGEDIAEEIEGMVTEPDNTELLDRVREVFELLHTAGSQEIVNQLCERFDVSQVVVEDYSVDSIAGFPRRVRYSLRCTSDDDYDLVSFEPLEEDEDA